MAGVVQGGANITATAQSGAIGTQSIHLVVVPAAASNTQTSDQVIEAARAGGQITDEQAFVYRVFAVYGSPQLPAQYRGRVDSLTDSSIRTEINERYPTLSLAAQTAIVPYLMPPIYAGSWGDPSAASAVTTSLVATSSKSKALLARTNGGPTTVAPTPTNPNPCANTAPPLPNVLPGWAHISTARFNIWYQTDPSHFGFFNYTPDQSSAGAANVAAIAEDVYTSLTGVMQRVPPSDGSVACNGGDAKIDIYVSRMNAGMKAQVQAYPGVTCTQGPSPAFMWIAPDAVADPREARDLFSHEFMHVLQFAFGRAANCNQYGWVEEGSAVWAVEHVYHGDNDYEHPYSEGYFSQAVGAFGSPGVFFPIDNGQSSTGYPLCAGGYCTYPLFQYIANRLDAAHIGNIFAAAESRDAVGAIAGALGGDAKLRDAWHDFSITAYNDHGAHVEDEFYQWDSDPSGFRNNSIPSVRLSNVDVDLQGAKSIDVSDKLYDAFQGSAALPGNAPINRLANKFVDIHFPDANARRAIFTNPASTLGDANLKIWALQKINGTWNSAEDWTHRADKVFCRDKPEERIEELVLIYSNGNPTARGLGADGVVDLDPGDTRDPDVALTPHLRASNFPCGRWTGNTRVRVDYDLGGFAEFTANVTLEREEDQTGAPIDETNESAVLVPRPGTSTATVRAVDVGSQTGCSQSIDLISGPIAAMEARVTVDFLSGTWIGGGITTIQNATHTLQCAGSDPIVAVGPAPSSWLIFPQTGAHTDPDGRSINGSETIRIAGASQTSEWHLQAEQQ
jgi:hypothetical protein